MKTILFFAFLTFTLAAELKDGVTVVTAENYQEVVFDSQADVLLKIYAPWCGHCKNLAPAYSQLAQRFEANPNVVIAEIDWTVNKIPGLDIRGYPTVLFFKKENGSYTKMEYNKGRTVEAFEGFLKDNTSHPWVELGGAEKGDL